MRCVRCNSTVEPGERFCGECGLSFPGAPRHGSAGRRILRLGAALVLLGALAVSIQRSIPTTHRPSGWAVVRPPYQVSVLRERGDLIWAGGRDGLCAIDRTTATLRPALPGQPSLRFVKDLLVDRGGRLWIAHEDGLTLLDGASWKSYGAAEGYPGDSAKSLLEDRDGDLWVGTPRGALRYDGKTWQRFTTGDGLAAPSVDVIFQDKDGVMWFGASSSTHGGLTRFDGKTWRTYDTSSGLAHNAITSIMQEPDGSMWIGTGSGYRGGASRLAGGTWTTVTRESGLAGEKVCCIFRDSLGLLWFGSEYDGAAVHDGNNWRVLAHEDGLAGREVKHMLQDSHGDYWLATDNGVSRIPRHESSIADRTVVVYTSVDQVYSEPILMEFEARTGIRVKSLCDVEAAKTTGLVNRLMAENGNPRADVFWNGEFSQTMLLRQQGALAPYRSSCSADLPAQLIDPDGYWTAVAGRARVLLVNTRLVPRAKFPRSVFDLLAPAWRGDQIGLAYPMFGTSATQAAALYAAIGPEAARDFYRKLHARGARVVDGNSVVRDLVASGQLSIGLTDTDDACGAVRDGAPVEIVIPDQSPDGIGTLVIPGTVALIAGAPHPAMGRLLIDFIGSREVEGKLIAAGWSDIPLRKTDTAPACLAESRVKGMAVRLEDVFRQIEIAKHDMTEIFVR
ncbi:MAG: ABC transporter substrate-binding protein [Acidobacteria bacterium]|nr:ABC transporter substrate-binding protein [Acidobacteriota bacterium]